MIKDIIMSFRENVREKSSNPFLSTYIIVWIIRNWELLYSILNFDSDKNLEFRITYIKELFSKTSFVQNATINILYTFLILIITYILLNLSRAIVNLFDKKVKPWVYKITDYNSIVLKSTYNILKNEHDDLIVRLEKERDTKSKLEKQIKILEDKIQDSLIIDIEKQSEKSKSDAQKIFEILKSEGLNTEFVKTAISIKKAEYLPNSNSALDRFLEFNLVKFIKHHWSDASKLYELTPDGDKVLKACQSNQM